MSTEDPAEEIRRLALGLISGIPYEVYVGISAGLLSAEEFFTLTEQDLIHRSGLQIPYDDRLKALEMAEREMEFILRHNIRYALCTDKEYPRRMQGKHGAPPILFMLGDADLNAKKMVSYVGTRNATPYGLNFCETSIAELGNGKENPTVVSGLAFGIDSASHIAALKNGLPTIAVVAHGLDTVYPSSHRGLAQSIVENGGGILTEYPSGTVPYPKRFLERNRIIAGISDMTVVVESDVKGGALSTAAHARRFGMNVAALPGRVNDKYSSGCNHLISSGAASIIEKPSSVATLLGIALKPEAVQQSLCPELTSEQKVIYEVLKRTDSPLTADQILLQVEMKIHQLLALLNEMEMDGLLIKHPGNRFATAF